MAKQTTTLKLTKKCKSVVRFDNTDEDNKVVDNIYLKKTAFEALGNPNEIEVMVRTKE